MEGKGMFYFRSLMAICLLIVYSLLCVKYYPGIWQLIRNSPWFHKELTTLMEGDGCLFKYISCYRDYKYLWQYMKQYNRVFKNMNIDIRQIWIQVLTLLFKKL